MANPAQCITIIGAEYGAALGIDRLMAAAGYDVQRADDLRIASSTLVNRPGAIVVASCTPNAPPLSMISTPRSASRDTPILILAPWASGTGSSALGASMGGRCTVEPFAPTEFLARLKTLVQESAPSDDDTATVLAFGDVEIDIPACAVRKNGVPVALTTKEFDLLVALIRMRGAIASRATLLKVVWGYHSEVVTRTVDIHIAELRRKLEPVPSEPRYLMTVRKRGYRFAGQRIS
ncbi:MAG: response regulator transcription factor [Gemmatimonadota bacterium]